ncbi:glycoside hydrolase family 16 protein [Pedobacter roseus]|uniref:Glycoside hydrolase family 16 protein n=1 Tax=Pedobacter roseus TaxID=336820 RepID=A0A7G9Q9Y5_9SPHI|nr:glycoside hydrolase family 16 protein [Pedobacter roseus]QNN40160.1 glycoside hydrolase family 16 protein [Pedobacter roseus]
MRKQSNHLKKMAGTMLLLTVLVSACKKSEKNDTAIPIDEKVTPRALTLVWQDEFDGNSLNAAKWNYENGNLGVNNEKQFYQTSNVSVNNGNLIITARKESVGGQPYTSGRINTNGKFSIKYGRIEARMKLPMVQGTWPAFWMLGSNIGSVGWPKCGEIDIMEHVNTSNSILGTIHWDYNGYVYYSNNTTTTPGDYHVYAVEWTSSGIRWYVDGNLYATGNTTNNINGTDEFHKPFFIIFNMAVGGNLPGQTINDAALPTSMNVDYVRVYNIS